MSSGNNRLKGVFLGAVTAITSSAIVLGSFLLAFSEVDHSFALPATSTIHTTSIPTRPSPPTTTPTIPSSSTPTVTPSSSALPTTTCPEPPDDWIQITIRRGDTLNKLAQEYSTTSAELVDVNCLTFSQFEGGETLYVPGIIPTEHPEKCVPRYDWYNYIVQPGDTLFSLSRRLGISTVQLRDANCLSSDTIYVNQHLFIPRPLSPLPSPTRKPKETDSPPRPTPTPTQGIITRPAPSPSALIGNNPSKITV